MRFVRYKQVCRLNFLGSDDELKQVASSFFKTKENSISYDEQINTKLMRFRLDPYIKQLKLKNPKLVLESIFIEDTKRWDYTNNTWVNNTVHNENHITVRLKNLDGINWDSTQNSESNAILFRGYRNSRSYINPSPKVLYNFPINESFLQQSAIEFEIIYEMEHGVNLNDTTSGNAGEYDYAKALETFMCSLVIYEEEEEELLLKDGGNIVDYKKFGATFPGKNKI